MLRVFCVINLFICCLFAKQEKSPVFSFPQELETAMEAAREAGSILLQYGNWEVDLEIEMNETTPVTISDFQSNEAICKKLLTAFPDYGLLTEERTGGEVATKATARWREADWTWVVDPLDGMQVFIDGGKDFGIQI